MQKSRDRNTPPMSRNYKSYPYIALGFLVIFATYFYFGRNDNLSSNSSSSGSHPASSSVAQTQYSRIKDFRTFFEATERIRAISLEKRENILFRDNGPAETLLWPKGNWVYVWHYFPPDFTCPHLQERIGIPSDGGKWMCGINLFEESQEKCIVYSMGVGNDSSFELEIVQRTNCDVFAYDFTVAKMNINVSDYSEELLNRIKFHKLGMGGKSQIHDPKFKTLKQIMEDNGHTWIDYLKMDIEGSEYEVFKDLAEEFETFPFGHLNVEIHLGNFNDDQQPQQKQQFKRLYDTWNLLEDKGMRAFTWEDNMVPCKTGAKPALMEYGFINCKDKRNKLIQF